MNREGSTFAWFAAALLMSCVIIGATMWRVGL